MTALIAGIKMRNALERLLGISDINSGCAKNAGKKSMVHSPNLNTSINPMTWRTWKDLSFWRSEKWEYLQGFLMGSEYYPKKTDIFKALLLTQLSEVRCVILGQDPYHTKGMATGLAFSVDRFCRKIPPSLQNVFKEYTSDTGYPPPVTGDLTPWARQGVLLLNTCLTVSPGEAGSHRHLGWQELTREIITLTVSENKTTVFILWGEDAKAYEDILGSNPRILSPHPSPFSAQKGFFGSRPFTKTNALLSSNKRNPVNWRLP